MPVTPSPVFELVGPAGAGKTAVLRAIAARHPEVRAGVRVDRVRGLSDVVWHSLALAPATLDLLFSDPRWVWSGLRHLGRLRTLPSAVQRARVTGPGAVLLDEGPVFSLGRLRVFQHAGDGTGWLAREWQAALERSSRLLDGIVLLDAPNDVLVDRIRGRTKAHQIKDKSDVQMFDFLDRYRAAYREISTRLATTGTRVVELDCAAAPVEQVAADVLTALRSANGRHHVVALGQRA